MTDAEESTLSGEIQRLRARIAELEREQHILRVIPELSPVMISIVRAPDFVYEFVNPALEKVAPGKEFIGRRFADVWVEAAEPLLGRLQDVIATGRTVHLKDAPHPIRRRPEGPPELVHASYSLIPLAGPDGKPDRILTIACEPTEAVRQRQAQGALRDSRQRLEAGVRERTAELDQAVAALEAERRRFRDVLDILPAYVVLLTPDYQVPFANRFFEERFGKSGGKRCYEYLFQRNEPCEVCETYSVLKTMAPHRWQWTGPDGRLYDIFDFPFVDADGSTLILEMGLDITEPKRSEAELAKYRERLEEIVTERTRQLEEANARLQAEIAERRQAEAALRESERTYSAIFDKAPYAMALTRMPETIVAGVNDAFLKLFEYPRAEEVIGKTSAELGIWDPSSQAQLAGELEVRGVVRDLEFTHTTRSGDGRTLSLNQDWVSIGGERHLLTTIRDITLRRRAEGELRQSRMDLDRAQEVGQIGSWRLDTRRNVLTWSDENHRIFGVPKGAPLTYETFLGIVHPDDRDYVDACWKAGLRGEPYDIEHRIVADGAVKWVREKAYLEFDEGGALLGGFGITEDITERKLIEEERARQSRLKDEFLALLGHELRNPLAAISTARQLLSGGVTAERRASLDELINRQVAVLRRLVDDLLDLGRIAQGRIELKQERVELSEFLQRVTAAARSPVAARGQEMVVRLPAEPVSFMGDGVRLEQVAANLLDNASKYTGQGGRIEISGAREGSEVVIRCKDNGRGIPLELQQRVFDPFVRLGVSGQSDQPGLGIGLALVRQLVELHGGAVSAESGGPGLGSEFVVRLPLVEAPSAQPAVLEAGSSARSRRGLTIAVVEDNRDVAQTVAIALEQAGHRVTVFADGLSALSGLSRLKPEAALIDIGLPGMDGYELAARLRKKRGLRHALLIAVSGHKRRAYAGQARDDFDHYFVKPVDVAELLALLETRAPAGAADAATVRRVLKGRKPLRALVVEDNADLAAATAELLRDRGLDVRTALSGQEALEVAADFAPHLALCDLRLPDMSGTDVVRALRSNPATRRTYAAILTALSEGELRTLNRRAAETGVDQYLSKPLEPDSIRNLLVKLGPLRRVSPK